MDYHKLVEENHQLKKQIALYQHLIKILNTQERIQAQLQIARTELLKVRERGARVCGYRQGIQNVIQGNHTFCGTSVLEIEVLAANPTQLDAAGQNLYGNPCTQETQKTVSGQN